jgi:hypothetical protein
MPRFKKGLRSRTAPGRQRLGAAAREGGVTVGI